MVHTCTSQHPRRTGGSSPPADGPVRGARVEILTPSPTPGIAVVELHGEIDSQSSTLLDGRLHTALQPRGHLLVDLTHCSLIDCTCLGLLVGARRTAHQHDAVLALVAPNPLVRLSLRATRLAHVFPTFTGREQALAALAAVRRGPLAQPVRRPPPARCPGQASPSAR